MYIYAFIPAMQNEHPKMEIRGRFDQRAVVTSKNGIMMMQQCVQQCKLQIWKQE
jgi:hypothetical protein